MASVSPLPTRLAGTTPREGTLLRLAKRTALLAAWCGVSPLVGLDALERKLRGPAAMRTFFAAKELLSLVPGLPGDYLRRAWYWSSCRAISPDTSFGLGSMVSRREAEIGGGTVVGAYSIVGRVAIGRDVLIASRVSVFSDRYLHGRPGGVTGGDAEPVEEATTRVGDGCWIGENAVVMASLGAGCTVAAGAVVVRPATDGSTLMGNPARRVDL